jgi:hypothetical protein
VPIDSPRNVARNRRDDSLFPASPQAANDVAGPVERFGTT